MSNTRKAEIGKPFRQERFASSVKLERGLMANLVAARCDVLESAADRELIYFLQLLSHREGGLRKVAVEILAMAPEQIATRSMLKFGMKASHYTARQVAAIRDELPDSVAREFPLYGDVDEDPLSVSQLLDRSPDEEEIAAQCLKAELHPDKYPVSKFIEICQQATRNLEFDLMELCLNPAVVFESTPADGFQQFAPWYFPNASEVLRAYHAAFVGKQRGKVVVTELGRVIYDTLEFTVETRCLTLIDGLARTGKTFAAKAWCEAHPGRARYVQVPSTNDEIGFFRAIAKAIGVSINLNSKAQELRQRVEEVLQRGHLAIIFDEAHYIWPNTNLRDAVPTRLTWIMTALVNFGVPVSLVTTPQFLRTQKAIERKSTWTSEQFIGRIGHYEKLPDGLPESDLNKVASALLPEGDEVALELLVRYAQSSAKYLAGIESAVRRARYLAGKEGRAKVVKSDIKRAVQDSVIPSDSALALAIAEPEKKSRRHPVGRVQTPCSPVAGSGETDGEEAVGQFTYRNTTVSPSPDRARSGGALVPA